MEEAEEGGDNVPPSGPPASRAVALLHFKPPPRNANRYPGAAERGKQRGFSWSIHLRVESISSQLHRMLWM